MTPVPISVRYNLDDDENYIDAYDAGVSLSGLSRTLSIVTHYLANDTVIKQAPALHGAQIVVLPPRRGSFVFDFNILFAPENPIGALSIGVASAMFYEMLKYIVMRTIGKDYKPKEQSVVNNVTANTGAIDAIVDTIEGDVANIHRPIIHNAKNVVIFHGDNNLVRLDNDSYDYVKETVKSNATKSFVGNVSSFNANSGRGRLFVNDIGRVVPFIAKGTRFNDREKSMLAWSLNEYANKRSGTVSLEAYFVSTQNKLLKKLIVTDVTRVR